MRHGWVVLCLGLLACARAEREQVVRSVVAGPTAVRQLELAAHSGTRLQLKAASPGCEALIYVLDTHVRAERELTLHNDSAEPRSYQLLVVAARSDSQGLVDIYRDDELWLRRVHAAGARASVRSGPGLTHTVAALPGSPRAAWLLALAGDGALLAFDEHSGPTGLPQLTGDTRIATLLLAAQQAGPLRLYANDALDRDGDGLGRRLERALGTCDSANDARCRASPLAEYYRKVGTRDSDRDGIPDGAELLGLRGPGLDFPRYGADPRHKDVFVELDHQARLQDSGFDEQDLHAIAQLYQQGSADVLRNPDQRPGVALHIDAGFAPRDPVHASLFGDYGGSGVSTEKDYRSARKRDFTRSREGFFRYAFSTRTGRGQASGPAFTVNRDRERVNIFAHELGHTLGLSHHGHDRWGKVNCKPNYLSIMNYLYQQRYDVGFARGRAPTLDPAAVLERAAARPGQAAFLRYAPLELDVTGRDVDWNRDGLISDLPVRAALTWATYKSCGAAESGISTLARDHVAAATPVLLAAGVDLYAVWLDDAGHVWWRRGSGDDLQWSWTEPGVLAGDWAFSQIAGAVSADGVMTIAAVTRDRALFVLSLTPESGLQLAAAIPGLRSEHAPGLAWAAGPPPKLRLLVRAADPEGRLVQVSAPSAKGPFELASLPLTAAGTPSLIALPSGELCGLLPDRESYLHAFCQRAADDSWTDLSSRAFDVGLGPQTHGPVGLAYHRYRDASAAAIGGETSRGALFATFTEPPLPTAPTPDNPHYLVSEWLSARHGAFEQLSLRWRGTMASEWTTLAPNTGVALAETADRPGLRALMVVRDDAHHGLRLDFVPHADGENDVQLAAGDDFAVMERGICLGIRSLAECGDETTAAY